MVRPEVEAESLLHCLPTSALLPRDAPGPVHPQVQVAGPWMLGDARAGTTQVQGWCGCQVMALDHGVAASAELGWGVRVTIFDRLRKGDPVLYPQLSFVDSHLSLHLSVHPSNLQGAGLRAGC